VAKLPDEPQPFDPQALCPMCGFNDTMSFPPIMYCWDDGCEDAEQGEHLHQSCPTCGYLWMVLPITDETLAELQQEQERQMQEEEQQAEERKSLETEVMKKKLETAPPGAAAPAPKKTAAPAKKAAKKV
jgi:hypothetical protein